MRPLLWRSVERANIIDYRFNDVDKTTRRRNNNKIRRDSNQNQGNSLSKEITTTRSEPGGYVMTKISGTGSIFISGVLTGSWYARTVNTNTRTNDEIVQVADAIDSDSDEVSNCDIEDSYFVSYDEEITNLHE